MCRLDKSLYGLRQVSRQWYTKFLATISGHNFIQCSADHSVFTCGSRDNLIILLVYVDAILLAGPNRSLVNSTQHMLESQFKLKVIGDVHFLLGLEIAHTSS